VEQDQHHLDNLKGALQVGDLVNLHLVKNQQEEELLDRRHSVRHQHQLAQRPSELRLHLLHLKLSEHHRVDSVLLRLLNHHLVVDLDNLHSARNQPLLPVDSDHQLSELVLQ
jgi:hypothetical protein